MNFTLLLELLCSILYVFSLFAYSQAKMDANPERRKQKIAPNVKRVKVCLENKEILKNLEWQWNVKTKGRLKNPSLELATTGGNINALLKWEDIDKPEQLMGKIVASRSGDEKEVSTEVNHELTFTELLPNTKYEIKIETQKKKYKVAYLKFLTNTALFYEVRLKKDEINPYRNINAQWSLPRQWTPTDYTLRLFRRSGEKIQENNTGGTTYTFEKLMSGEGFCLEVIAMGKDISGLVTSNFVETTHRARNDVNITKLGAVSNCRHEFIEAGDKVKCRVRWESPNLGVESNNFDKFAITTRAKDISGSGSTMGPIENRDTEAIFSFDWGKKYEISVIGKGRDLDTFTVTEAPYTEIIQTDFEETKRILAATDGDTITITWLPAKGAKYYQVKISNGLQGLCDDSGEIPAQQLKYQFKSTPKCSAGHYFEIDVISIDHIGREKMASVGNHFLGTADMPQHAQISHGQGDPYRCLEIQWKPPSNHAISSFECALFTHDGACVSRPQTKTDAKHTFVALKTGTKYYAAVSSLKQDGTQGSWCYTKICKTQSGKRIVAKDEVRILGKVRDLVAAKNATNTGEITCCVQWKLSDSTEKLKEDYGFESFRLEWSAKGRHPRQKDVLSRNDGTYKEFLNLKPGRIYIIRVIAAYKDLDDDSLLESTEECYIDMGITLPTLVVKYIKDQIILTWKKVKGASLYKIHITDVNNEFLSSLETTGNDKQIPIEGNLAYGRRCKISLIVVDENKRESSTQPLLETIGGQNLPHTITLRKNHENPRRTLELTWNTDIEPEITTIDLYEKGRANPVKSIRPNERSAIFDDLKSSTTYFAQIESKTGKRWTVSCPSNEVITDRALKGNNDVPRQPKISVNPLDRYRSVDIQWIRPQAEVISFECILYSSGEILAAEPIKTEESRVTFRGLKQGTKYYGIVKSIKSDGQTGGSSRTNTCATLSGKSKASNEFVQQYCTVRNLSLLVYTSRHDGDLICSLRWKIPNTDKVKCDYIFKSTVVTCKPHSKVEETESYKKTITNCDDDDYESFVPLFPGKQHTIQVIALYIDRDNGTEHEAIVTKEIHADIAAPEFEVKNMAGKTKISWKYVKGATSYKVQIFDANTKMEVLKDKTEKNWCTFPVDERVHYGMLCYFVVASISSSEVKTNSRRVLQVIGGENLPHSIELKTDPKDSRGLLLNWKSNGINAIEITKVQLYEKGKLTPSKCVKPGDRSAHFRYLKSSTRYRAKVGVIVNGSHVECPSNEVTTKSANKYDTSLSNHTLQLIEKRWKVEVTDTAIKWEPIDFGKQYETTGYNLKVVEVRSLVGKFLDFLGEGTLLLEKNYPADVNTEAFPKMKANHAYDVTVKPKVMLIDKEEELVLNGKTEKRFGPIDEPILEKTTYDGNFAIFQWKPVPGADGFELEIRDAFSNRNLIDPLILPNVSCTKMTSVDMAKNLRAGISAEVRLTATASKSTDKSTKWIPWTIGGDQVPRDVVVEKNCDNPQRRIDIRFKTPENSVHLEKYRIVACPTNGRVKEKETDKTNFTFKRLMSNTDYCFKVFAIYKDGKESIASISETITTDASLFTGIKSPMFDWTGSSGATVKMQNTSFIMKNKVEQRHVEDRIRNIEFVDVDVSGSEVDIVKWTWSSPSFSIDPENFYVLWYEWKIMDALTKKEVCKYNMFVDDENTKSHSYTTENKSLALGNSYQFEIKACYEDIDRDTRKESAPQFGEFTARPRRPNNVTCRCDEAVGKLVVKWNTAEGAESYKIEILNEDDRLLKDAIEEKFCTNWEIEHLYEDIGYGVRCYARVTAIGSGKEHSGQSDIMTVGGIAVPRSLRAENDPDISNAAIVSWLRPIQHPDGGYLVEVFHAASSENEPVKPPLNTQECNVRVKDLEPGTDYIFKVYAFHAGKMSVGCKTNKIQSTAGSGKPGNINAKQCDQNPSAAILVEWKKEDKCAEYKLVVTNKKGDIVRIMYTAATTCYVDGLSPRTHYICTVAGGTGNKRGFGNDSDPFTTTTGSRQPTHVKLMHRKDTKTDEYINPESSLELSFEGTGEKDVSYVATLYEKDIPLRAQYFKRSPVIFENLTPNRSFHATVHVQYGIKSEEGLPFSIKSNTTLTASRPPENVIAKPKEKSGVTLNTVVVKWESPAGCNTHKITVRKANTDEVVLLVRGNSSCEYQCLDGSCDYSFSVQTRNKSEIFSEPRESGNVKFAPAKIREVMAKLHKDDRIEVKWEKPDNKAQSYRVAAIADGKHFEQIETSETRCLFGADSTVVRYRFQVVPLGESGQASEHTLSNIVKMKPPNTTILFATPSKSSPSSSMEITWENLMNNNINYKLEITQSKTGEKGDKMVLFAEWNESRCIHECSMPGRTYWVRVQSRRSNVPGNWSEWVECELVPPPPTNVRLDPSKTEPDTCIHVSFEDEAEHPNKKYAIYVDDIKKGETHESKYTIEGLTPGSESKISVSSIVGKRESSRSFAKEHGVTVPGAVTKITPGAIDGDVVYEWDHPQGIRPKYYIVQYERGGRQSEETTPGPTYRIPHPDPVFWFRVAAVNISGTGKWSEWEPSSTGGEIKITQSQDKDADRRELRDSGEYTRLITDKETGMKIYYKLRDRVRPKSMVFVTKRPGADGNEVVILKIIDEVSKRNIAEVKNLKQVTRHENIVKYYASGICDYEGTNAIYIQMEKCDRETLWEKLKTGRNVAYHKRKFDIRGIGEGLRYIHQRGIVHRDLKPHNILQKDGLPVISDFGLSKKLPDAKSNTAQSIEDAGTDGWRAPETGDKNPETRKASDIYSYGLVSHYVLTNGKHLFGENARSWHTYIYDDDRTKMSWKALEELPDGQLSKDLIEATLERKPENRPTIDEVLSHPFFWDDRRKLEFLSDACKYLELVKGLKIKDAGAAPSETSPSASYLSLDDKSGKYAKEDMTGWKENLLFSEEQRQEFQNKSGCDVEVNYMTTKAKKARNCVSDLIKFIRNRYTHDHEDKTENVDMTNEELWAFFSKKFPFLLLFVYYKMKDYFVEKSPQDKDFSDTLARYFNQ